MEDVVRERGVRQIQRDFVRSQRQDNQVPGLIRKYGQSCVVQVWNRLCISQPPLAGNYDE